MIKFKAIDCTRPADSPFLILAHKIGEIEYPTNRSRTRRACWASTKFISIDRGVLNAFLTVSLVISLNTTRFLSCGSSPNKYERCHAIASPSRSGSDARYTWFAFFASLRSSLITSPLPRIEI